MLFVVWKTPPGNQVRILLCGDERRASGRASDAVDPILSALDAASPRRHVSAQLTARLTAEHQWQQLSALEPRAHSSWENHETNYTRNIRSCSICTWPVCGNGLSRLINISIFNPVTWMRRCSFARPWTRTQFQFLLLALPASDYWRFLLSFDRLTDSARS